MAANIKFTEASMKEYFARCWALLQHFLRIMRILRKARDKHGELYTFCEHYVSHMPPHIKEFLQMMIKQAKELRTDKKYVTYAYSIFCAVEMLNDYTECAGYDVIDRGQVYDFFFDGQRYVSRKNVIPYENVVKGYELFELRSVAWKSVSEISDQFTCCDYLGDKTWVFYSTVSKLIVTFDEDGVQTNTLLSLN